MRVVALCALIVGVASAVALPAAGTAESGARQQSGLALDIEIAVDSTGSMGPLISQAQKDAQAIIDAVGVLDPSARFAVVAFRDPAYPAPEYEVLQGLTTNTESVKAAIGRLRSVTTKAPGNVASEGYNLLFDKSVSDTSLGWRPSSRKVVVVLGDAEPHGAGTLGLPGCRDTTRDLHGLNTVDVLERMRAAGRTLLMVRQNGIDATLECYRSIAGLAAPGGAARDAGTAGLAGPIQALLQGTRVTLAASAGFPLALPGTKRTLTFKVENRSGDAATLKAMALLLPTGTSFVSGRGAFGRPSIQGRKVAWTPTTIVAPGSFSTLLTTVRVRMVAAPLLFRATLDSTLADGSVVTSSAVSRLRVGRTLSLKVAGSDSRKPASGSVSLTYPSSARSLVGNTTPRGKIQLGAGSSRIVLRVDKARVRAAATVTAVTARAIVVRSARPSCQSGSSVSVNLVDRDVRQPSQAADLIQVLGRGCAIRVPGDVTTR